MVDARVIRELCESWRAETLQPDGGLAIGGASERFRLLANGVAFHDLDYDSLRAACLGLTSVLLLPGQNTVIDHDHFAFWAWCGQLLCGGRSTYFNRTLDDAALKQLMELCVRASVVGTYRPDREGWEEMVSADRRLDVYTQAWKRGGHTALSYLAFPLLEGVTKRHCSDFVSADGRVIQAWQAPQADGGPRTYQVGRRCSSLLDLLGLLQETAADAQLRSDLGEIAAHISTFSDEGAPGFAVLYDWRNGSLHGANLYGTVGGTVFNTALLIALSRLKPSFDELRLSTLEQVRWELQGGSDSRSPWSYYPPYT